MNDVSGLLTLAKAVVQGAARLLAADADGLRRVIAVELGGRETKLAADLMLDERLRTGLSASGLPMFTEESGATGDVSRGRCWVVDPLDGSVNYLRGSGPSAISVALCEDGVPVFGVLHSFQTGALSWGGPELGAWTNGAAITVSATARAADGTLCSGLPARFDTSNPTATAAYLSTLAGFAKLRMLGSAASSLLLVASGAADAYYEESIMLWDVAAGAALVRGAGGLVSLRGQGFEQPYAVVATNGRVSAGAIHHDQDPQ